MTTASTARAGAAHALDPLSPAEIEQVVRIVRGERELPETTRFVAISPAEPAKDGPDDARVAEVILYDSATATTVEASVELGSGTVVGRRELTGVHPQMTVDDFAAVEDAVKRNPRFAEALRRRGVDDLGLVDVDPVSAGYHGQPAEDGTRRLARILAYVRPTPGGNAYARPVEGVFGLVDIDTGELVHFEDRDPVPLPREEGEFRSGRVGPERDDLRPIEITQPEGPSFEVSGYELRWQKWRLRIGFTTREGLVLHRIGYEDDGRVRPILHRASYAEMVVPYADPDRFYQSPLDIGEFNIGTMTNSLTLGCDCLGEIRYFDAAYVRPDGTPVTIPNAICLHEEDDGILWKHSDFRTGHVEVRRGRRLVISSIATVGNYDYGFFWYLHQDGRIASEVKATGIVATQARADGDRPRYGKLVAPGLAAMNHQHAFCVRLDMDVDGPGNTVFEVDAEPVDSPLGNAWRSVERPLRRELEARRQVDPSRARRWLVVNPSRTNAVGDPVAYQLVPGDNTVPFSAPGCSQRRRAGFADHHLWVTPYRPDERYPAGDYPYQHRGGDGLPRWTEADRPIEDTDLVVWYTMNHHHVPRPEDWPVMPVARIGFELRPVGFFNRNPTLDLPPPEHHCGTG